MLIRTTVQEKRDGNVLKNIKTAHIEIAGDKELVELLQGLLEGTLKKYSNHYTIG